MQVGLCNVPPPGLQRSLLSLSNNCCVAQSFEDLRQRFCKLYTRRAMVHHYTQVNASETEANEATTVYL